ncbi:MAG: ExbD/TolR family protein [Chthoniobacterales bacterium]
MRRFANRQAYQSLSELNVTPLIDLAFVLLITFMITTPLIESSVELIVPTTTASGTAVNVKDVHMLAIDKNGIIQLNDEAVSTEVLSAELKNLLQANPKTAVVIRPDRTLSIQVLVSLMDLVKEAGITKVGLMTREDETTP